MEYAIYKFSIYISTVMSSKKNERPIYTNDFEMLSKIYEIKFPINYKKFITYYSSFPSKPFPKDLRFNFKFRTLSLMTSGNGENVDETVIFKCLSP